MVVFFCKWYFKSYFCIRGCLLRHKPTAPYPNLSLSLLFSRNPSTSVILFTQFFIVYRFFFSFKVKHAAEMDLLLWTRSLLKTSPAVFSLFNLPLSFLPISFLKARHF